jgi:hypothetical protein
MKRIEKERKRSKSKRAREADNNYRRLFFNQAKSVQGSVMSSMDTGEPHSLVLGDDYFSYALCAFYLFSEEDMEICKVET